MPSIPCPGGVSGYWKTKSEALKWAKKVNDWPCSPVSKCQGALGCDRTGLFFKTKLRDGKTVWYAMVECICPPPGIPTEEESITFWAHVPAPAQAKPKSKTSPRK